MSRGVQTALALVILLLGAGCAGGAKAPAAMPAAPASPVVATPPPQAPVPAPVPLPAPAIEPVRTRIADAEKHFDAGQLQLAHGHLVGARTEFDLAIETLLQAPPGAKGDPQLRAAYEQLLTRISALEAAALRQGDGFAAATSEPAAIDELLSVATFPRATARTETSVAAGLEEAAYDLPVVANDKVLSYVELFQGNLRNFLAEGLRRGAPYLPRIRDVFRANGIPLDLAYVPLIESGFKSTALSRTKAKGMWQFQLPTAKDYGLKFDWFVDERSDFEKSTLAAAKHLKMLGTMFKGDWNLALASYNVGQGKVLRAMTRSKLADYWALSSSTRWLPRDTREYVPMIWAAIIIAKNPEEFGFDAITAEPHAPDLVTAPDAIDLRIVAEWAGTDADALRALNPELRRTTTPLGPYVLKVPAGTKEIVEAALGAADPAQFTTFVRYTVKSGESIRTIARRFRTVTSSELAEANGLKTSSRLRTGMTLLVPGATVAPPATTSTKATATAAPAARTDRADATTAATPTTYRVQSGDTLYGIARRFDVTVDEIKQWNGLTTAALSIGKRLTILREGR